MIVGFIHPFTGNKHPLDDFSAFESVVPPGVLSAIVNKERSDERHKGTNMTITMGMNCPRKIMISRMLDVFVDPTKVWAPMRGTLMHEHMGHFMSTTDDSWYTEELNEEECIFEGSLMGVDNISCKIDCYKKDLSALWDFKFRKWMPKDDEARETDACQLNMARMLIEQTKGVSLRDMEMVAWVECSGWKKTVAPYMTEAQIRAVRPGGGDYQIEKIFDLLMDAMHAWIVAGGEEAPVETRESIIKSLPMVGENMYKTRYGGTMCTAFCEMKDVCFGLEGGL